EAILPEVREGFDLIAASLSRAHARRSQRQLVVSITPSIAAKWLMPRLEGFLAAHPDVEVRIDATTRLVDFAREDVDVALRFGAGNWPALEAPRRLCAGTWPALEAARLMEEEASPVCSPQLLAGGKAGRRPLREPRDLR